jgi:hypothetical protein
VTIEEFETKLLALSSLTPLLRVVPGEKVVSMAQDPEHAISQITQALADA